ncbi:MAG: erythromycin esterase family protein [Propionibacteriaceae bacterium]|nr:erythromycin esterase family protein [Propionibacteriaceae bacterium]
MTTTSTPSPRRIRTRVLSVLAALLVLAVGSFYAWRTVATAPAGEPQAVEFGDASLSGDLTAATVLALGEATHGTSEFQRARLVLTQKVADEGFTTIALEEPAGSATAVDAWLQGGPGTVEEAAAQFGFSLYRTRETAELLTWIRERNLQRPERERIRLYGIDMQRPEADKRVVLDWLGQVDPAAAAGFAERLGALTEETDRDRDLSATVLPTVHELADAVEAAAAGRDDDATLRARWSARSLVAGREYTLAGSTAADRDAIMADQLAWLVDRRAEVGGAHTLLFGHNGHLDRAGQASAVPGAKLGQLAAQRWGRAYRAIGTDGHHVGFRSSGEDFEVTVNSPIRGIFADTTVGWLEVAGASATNRSVLERSMPMVSAGVGFAPWQAWLAPFHEVQVTPTEAWDAVIYVSDAHPSAPLA